LQACQNSRGSPKGLRYVCFETRFTPRARQAWGEVPRKQKMCGIAGFVSLTSRSPEAERLARMIATLRHRGPDDRGLFTDGPAALGAARLSIIDVAGGHQ